jgi:hypothetical protein
MLAGLDLISRMPPTDHWWCFPMEDLNSAFKEAEVLNEARQLDRFTAFAIDYMPGQTKDKFLVQFASQHRGQVWKAAAESNIVPIFQSVASEMMYYYVISYAFLPSGKLSVSPASVEIDLISVMAAAPDGRIDNTALTVKPQVDSLYGIARWKVSVSNTGGSVATLDGEGTPAPELKIPLPTELTALAAGGDFAVKMEATDRKGQSLVLDASPVKVRVFETRADLAVEPAGLTVEEIKTIDSSPMLGHVFFASGSSEIQSHVRFTTAETAGFDEQKFVALSIPPGVNIIGKRMMDNPEAKITLVGCNDNTGVEKGNKKALSQRAETVKITSRRSGTWPERMLVEVRNLPRNRRGRPGRQEENRRVEIHSDDPAILPRSGGPFYQPLTRLR